MLELDTNVTLSDSKAHDLSLVSGLRDWLQSIREAQEIPQPPQ